VEIIEKDFGEVKPFINQLLDEHTAQIFGEPVMEQKIALAFIIDDEIKAAVSGTLRAQNFHVGGLGVDEQYRHQGLGSKLLVAIEEKAIAAGAKVLTVSTQCFQAPDFYKKHGYHVFGELAGMPFAGVTKYYLSKRV